MDTKDIFVRLLRSRHIVTMCWSCAS